MQLLRSPFDLQGDFGAIAIPGKYPGRVAQDTLVLFTSVVLSYLQVEAALILSGLAGMTAGFVCKRYREICQ